MKRNDQSTLARTMLQLFTVALIVSVTTVLAVGAAPAAWSQARSQGQAAALPSSGAWFGASYGRGGMLGGFESLIGRRIALERVYYTWLDEFPNADDYAAKAEGRQLLISWDAGIRDGGPVAWSDIASGAYDSTIDARAADLKAFTWPVILIFHHEPWLEDPSGTPAEYVDAFRHVHDRFVTDGVTNVLFADALLASQYDTGTADQFYPGDAYVDVLGVDGYNWYGCGGGHEGAPWKSFQEVFQSFYDYGMSKGKPMVIAEYASGEDSAVPGRKAAWISGAQAQLKLWPQIKAVSWFNAEDFSLTCDWMVDTTPTSLAAFQAMGADPWENPPPQPAPETNVMAYVQAIDYAFSGVAGAPTQGKGATWLIGGPSSHSVTDSSGMGYFDSGVKTAGSSWTFTFVGAGSYNYKCTVTPGMTGRLKVPMVISPITGKLATVFTVTWSSDKAPTGYVFDIKILRPGISTWKSWLSDQTGRSATFVPDGGLGTYTFKSRLRKVSNGLTSGYSPTFAITVTV